MEKEFAKKEAKIFFDHSPALREVFVAEDRQCFLKQFDASSHSKRNKNIKFLRITREDYKVVIETPETDEPKLTPKQKLQAEATALGIEFEEVTTSKDLQIMIDLKKEEAE